MAVPDMKGFELLISRAIVETTVGENPVDIEDQSSQKGKTTPDRKGKGASHRTPARRRS
jgi:hypothetical protein